MGDCYKVVKHFFLNLRGNDDGTFMGSRPCLLEDPDPALTVRLHGRASERLNRGMVV